MMNGWHSGMGWAGWMFMSFFWVLLLLAVVWAAAQLFPQRHETAPAGPTPATPAERPEQILDRRLASGEIDVETYEQIRSTLAKPTGGELR